MRRLARSWAIRWQDKFWEGDRDAPDENAFGPLASVAAFATQEEAEFALETLNLNETMREQCKAVPIIITVHD